MYGVKGKKSRTYFREIESIFFSDFVMPYFVDIFSEPPKSLFTNKFRNCSIFDKTSQKVIDLKGVHKITRPPETLKCNQSKKWGPRKLKLHQPGYLIR